MKISELLNENEQPGKANPFPSKLSSAPSIDDEPQDMDDESDDKEDSPEIKKFKEMAGSLGHDLYIISMYDYKNDFGSIGPNQQVRQMLKKIDDSVVDDYVGQSNIDITNDKLVSVLIYNDRNGEFIKYNAGDGAGEFDDIEVDNDQLTPLKKIGERGLDYSDLVGEVEWKAGESAPRRVGDALRSLLMALKLPEFEAISFNNSDSIKLDANKMKAKFLALKAEKEAQKQSGAGRETR